MRVPERSVCGIRGRGRDMYEMVCIFVNIGMCVNVAHACHCSNKNTYMWRFRQGFKRLKHLLGWRSVRNGRMIERKDKDKITMEVDRQRGRSRMKEVVGENTADPLPRTGWSTNSWRVSTWGEPVSKIWIYARCLVATRVRWRIARYGMLGRGLPEVAAALR